MLNSYKDLIVWQKSIELVKQIYLLVESLPKNETYGLSSQMTRAAVSIPSNIAEGYSRKNTKEYVRFLKISYGSGAELETQLIIAKELYKNLDCTAACSLLEEVMKMLNSLIQKLRHPES